MKLVTAADVWYTQQQKTLDEIAEKLGVVAYRPSYHGAERDKNTVLFYLKEDEEHNREVDQRELRKEAAVVDGQVGLADAAGLDADDDLVRAGHRLWQIDDGKLTRGGILDRFHRKNLQIDLFVSEFCTG